MRMSASRIRSINRAIARVNGIIVSASDTPRRVLQPIPPPPTTGVPPHTIRIVAVAPRTAA